MENKSTRNVVLALLGIAVLIAAFFWFNNYIYQQKQGDSRAVENYKEATFRVDGQPVTLTGGAKYFGNEARGDLNGDGAEDIAFIFTYNTGGCDRGD